jgi:CMP-N-acetylneuraminic acid synthetase
MMEPRVTVYIPCRNYGRFLNQAVDSVVSQTLTSWELIILDEASSDESAGIASAYVDAHPGQVRLIRNQQPLGLRGCANLALEMATGEFIIRLDADDYFDENALLVLSHYLDAHPEVALVYPNWIYIDEQGGHLGIERRKKVGQEDSVLDLPAHGACTMVRRRVLKMIGGYDEKFSTQDGHELWMKVVQRFQVGNVATPLFFYRQHGTSMSRDEEKLLESRRRIKAAVAGMSNGPVKPRVLAVVPVKNTYRDLPNIALAPLASLPLVDHTLAAAVDSGVFASIVVTTDDPRVVEHCKTGRTKVECLVREAKLSDSRAKLAEVVNDAVTRYEASTLTSFDIVVVLSIHSPLRRAEHIQEAVHTLQVYEVDRVISIYEDQELHFVHGKTGLEPLNPGIVNTLRFEREALFVDTGAINAFWRELLDETTLYSGRIGHIVTPRWESMQIKGSSELPIIEHYLQLRMNRLTTCDQR